MRKQITLKWTNYLAMLEKKAQVYVIASICRDLRMITHIDVVEERSQEAIQNFVDELPV